MSNPPNIISLNITKFPQNLLIPDIDNDVSIQIISNSNKKENYRFGFEGENKTVIPVSIAKPAPKLKLPTIPKLV